MIAGIKRGVRGWEALLLVLLAVVILVDAAAVPGYLQPQNQINVLQLSIEKVIVVLAMTFVIVSGDIDLSVASVMGLAAVLVAWLTEAGVPMAGAIVVALGAG